MKRTVVPVAALALLVAPWLSGPAQAVSSCTWSAIDQTLSVSIGFEEIGTFRVSGTEILFNGSPCDPLATTLTVNTIDVAGDVGAEVLVLDLRGGPFGPGAEVELTGTSEIEIASDLFVHEIRGTATADTISLGSNGGNLNDDDDVDLLFADTGWFTVWAGDGNDSISGGGDPVVGSALALTELDLDGGMGNDSLRGGRRFDQLFGGPGADSLAGGAAGDELIGGVGADSLEGGPGNDGLRGGQDRDRITYASSPTGVVVNLNSGVARTNPGTDEIDFIEDVIGSSFSDVIIGNALPNQLHGGPGRDRLLPGPGSDRASGGPGIDTLDLSEAVRRVTIDLSIGRTSGEGADRISGFERALGSRFADMMIGNGSANMLAGRRGDDGIRGLAGPDRLFGGAGHDALRGGAGPDLLHGGVGDDRLVGGPGTDTCYQDAGSGSETSCE